MTIIVKTIKRIATGLLVAGFAVTVASAANTKQAGVKWTPKGTTWEKVEGQYSCISSSEICTRTYPEGHDPNSNPNGFLIEENGLLVQ